MKIKFQIILSIDSYSTGCIALKLINIQCKLTGLGDNGLAKTEHKIIDNINHNGMLQSRKKIVLIYFRIRLIFLVILI